MGGEGGEERGDGGAVRGDGEETAAVVGTELLDGVDLLGLEGDEEGVALSEDDVGEGCLWCEAG